jgi:hypothetical protein
MAVTLRENADGRAAADHAVALGNRHTTLFGNVAGERAANEIQRPERDDVRIEKEVAQERFNGFKRVWAAELKEDDANSFFGITAHGHFLFFGREESAS